MKLALTLPGFKQIDPRYLPTQNATFDPNTVTLGSAITAFGEVALYIGGFLMFFWAVWGVFDYLRAEGNKEALAKARKKIQWAIAGFVILVLAFFISDYLVPLLAARSTSRTLSPLTF